MMQKRVWGALGLWLLLLLVAEVSVAEGAERWGVPMMIIQEQQQQPLVVADVFSWLRSAASSLFRSSLQRFAQARHRFYSRILDQIVPAPFLRTRFGNPGATEPLTATIPEPPIISHKARLNLRIAVITKRVLRDYYATSVTFPGGVTDDAVTEQLGVFASMMKSRLEAELCGSKLRGGCLKGFCHLLSDHSDVAVDKVLARLGLDKIRIVTYLISRPEGYRIATRGLYGAFYVKNDEESSYGQSFPRAENGKTDRMNQLCDNPAFSDFPPCLIRKHRKFHHEVRELGGFLPSIYYRRELRFPGHFSVEIFVADPVRFHPAESVEALPSKQAVSSDASENKPVIKMFAGGNDGMINLV